LRVSPCLLFLAFNPSFEFPAVEGPAATKLRRAGDLALGGHRLHSSDRQADQRQGGVDVDSLAHLM
jgi:hypothetical protein